MEQAKSKAVFLDRDGVLNKAKVINGKSYPPQTLEEFELLPSVTEAINALKEAGYLVVVVTNQPDVATGKQTRDVVEAMHEKLRDCLSIDALYVCYHADEDACECRKPAPGMILNAAAAFNIELEESYLVGDRWKDIEAGQSAGCRCYFINYGYQEASPEQPFIEVPDLYTAVQQILKE